MRPQQQNRRMRGRNNNNSNNNQNRKGPNPLTRNYESNGPDVKIRGSAQQIAEKYTTLARDAHSAGDRVMAENYLQHAEHYNRIIAAAQAQMPIQQQNRDGAQDEDDLDEERDDFDGGQDNRGQMDTRGQQDNRGQDNRGQQDRGQENRNQDGNRNQDNRNQQEGRGQQEFRSRPQPSDGSGPQPVIEGVPAEVALNQDPEDGGNRMARGDNGGANGAVAEDGPRRPRRPRRGRSRSEGEAPVADAEASGGDIPPPEAGERKPETETVG